MTFFVDDVLQSIGDFGIDTAEVATFFKFFLAIANALHHLAKTLYSIAIGVGHSLTHQAT